MSHNRVHLHAVSRPMLLPSYAQQGDDFELICEEPGPVSAIQTLLCAVNDILQILDFARRQAPWSRK